MSVAILGDVFVQFALVSHLEGPPNSAEHFSPSEPIHLGVVDVPPDEVHLSTQLGLTPRPSSSVLQQFGDEFLIVAATSEVELNVLAGTLSCFCMGMSLRMTAGFLRARLVLRTLLQALFSRPWRCRAVSILAISVLRVVDSILFSRAIIMDFWWN